MNQVGIAFAALVTRHPKGTIDVPFSELFQDTVVEHGEDWAFCHYVVKHGMPLWEWEFWLTTMAD